MDVSVCTRLRICCYRSAGWLASRHVDDSLLTGRSTWRVKQPRLQQRMSDYFQTTWSLNHGIETYEVSLLVTGKGQSGEPS